jgi:hypothetical protein
MSKTNEYSLGVFLKNTSENFDGKKLEPEYLYVGDNKYSYSDLLEKLELQKYKISELSDEIILLGDDWYIQKWIFIKEKFKNGTDNEQNILYDYYKYDIEKLFNNGIPDEIVFCDSCEELITKDELNQIHSCKSCAINGEFCFPPERRKKKKNGYCKSWCMDMDSEEKGEFCAECIALAKQMEEHPGSFWGIDDEDYDDAFHGWMENDY